MSDIEKVMLYEKESRFYTLTFTDQNGTQVPLASMSTLKLSLFLKDSSPVTIINSRNQQNVLGVNDVTISGPGVIVWNIKPADSTLSDANAEVEIHVAVFELTTTGGTPLIKRKEVHVYVDNVEAVT